MKHEFGVGWDSKCGRRNKDMIETL